MSRKSENNLEEIKQRSKELYAEEYSDKKIHEELVKEGFSISRPKVSHLLRCMGLPPHGTQYGFMRRLTEDQRAWLRNSKNAERVVDFISRTMKETR